MKKLRIKTSLLVSASAVAGLAMGAGIAMATHPPIQLYTYEEVANQMGFPAAAVMVDATSKSGMPYSPKQTCFGAAVKTQPNGPYPAGTKCHGDDASDPKLKAGYSDLADHAFHAALGYGEWMDNSTSGLFVQGGKQTGLNPQKPWLQS